VHDGDQSGHWGGHSPECGRGAYPQGSWVEPTLRAPYTANQRNSWRSVSWVMNKRWRYHTHTYHNDCSTFMYLYWDELAETMSYSLCALKLKLTCKQWMKLTKVLVSIWCSLTALPCSRMVAPYSRIVVEWVRLWLLQYLLLFLVVCEVNALVGMRLQLHTSNLWKYNEHACRLHWTCVSALEHVLHV